MKDCWRGPGKVCLVKEPGVKAAKSRCEGGMVQGMSECCGSSSH